MEPKKSPIDFSGKSYRNSADGCGGQPVRERESDRMRVGKSLCVLVKKKENERVRRRATVRREKKKNEW